MELKLDGLGKKDMLKFKNLSKERGKVIKSSSSKDINTDFKINDLANQMHPKIQYVKVTEIITETPDTKTFILEPDVSKGTKKLAYFRAGQYVSVRIRIGEGIYRRPYTLSSSPKLALKNKYAITIKRVENGIVSNYFLDKVEVGFTFSISAPTGVFYYERLRDAYNVIAIAGGSGVTPFMSMAEAIVDGTIDFKLTIIYGARTKKDFIFKERLDEIAKKTEKVKVVYVISDEISSEYEMGYIDSKVINPYLGEENSFFVCGPIGLYEHMNEVLKEYNLAAKYVRHDLFFGEIDKLGTQTYNVTVLTHDVELSIRCKGNETLLSAMEKEGILAPSKCHVGECGFCRSKLIKGKIKTFDDAGRMGDRDLQYIHPCASFPESDVVIKLPN